MANPGVDPLNTGGIPSTRMRFICQLSRQGGNWSAEHTGANLGPIRVTAATREEVLRKMEAEIRYWLEMCPCSGEAYRDIHIEVVESS